MQEATWRSKQAHHIVHVDKYLLPRKLNKKKIKMENAKVSGEKNMELNFFLQELRWKDSENDLFFWAFFS